MSTRCQIGIYKDAEQAMDKPTCLMYRHSDGYPEGKSGVMNCIMPFLQKFKERRGLEDTEYLPAWLMYSMIAEKVEWMKRHRKKFSEHKDFYPEDGMDMLGYGICGDHGFHGDIEYYYRINAAEGEVVIYKASFHTKPDDWDEVASIKIDDWGDHPWFDNGDE